jgi:hypothetical protein
MRNEYAPPEQQGNPIGQDVHCLVQSASKPETFWIQHHNGIFKSTDGAASWSEIKDVKPSVFGFPVAVHPKDPDTAWFVPSTKDEKRCPTDGCVVVNRTRDGGKTFETLRKGLPQRYAYDLVYRHALDVDETGDRLVFARQQDRCESAKTPATRGRKSHRIFRRICSEIRKGLSECTSRGQTCIPLCQFAKGMTRLALFSQDQPCPQNGMRMVIAIHSIWPQQSAAVVKLNQ